jgi:hypothetical protein
VITPERSLGEGEPVIQGMDREMNKKLIMGMGGLPLAMGMELPPVSRQRRERAWRDSNPRPAA